MRKKLFTTIALVLTTVNIFAFSGGNGTETNPYLISSRADMEELARNVNNGQSYTGVHFLLTRDLTGENDTIRTPIGRFVNLSRIYCFGGIFNGGGHKIAINIGDFYYLGLFGCIDGATIKNLGVSGKITGVAKYAGGICGTANRSSIYNCFNEAEINVIRWPDPNNVYTSTIGGICGWIGLSIISNSYNIGNITAYADWSTVGGISGTVGLSGPISRIENSYNFGVITAISDRNFGISGGIVGENAGAVSNSFVTNSQIKGNTNDVTRQRIGRIIGVNTGIIENCFADFLVSINGNPIGNQNANSKDGRDAAMADFQNQSWIETNLGWDFENIWAMSDISSANQGLPILRSQLRRQQFTISVSAGENGTISPNTDQILAYEESVKFTFSPNTGYKIDQVLINGVNNLTAVLTGSYTFENVIRNHSILVRFKSLAMSELEEQLILANALISTLQSENLALKNDTTILGTNNRNLQTQLNTANGTISTLQTQNTNLQNQLNGANGMIIALQNDLNAANSTISTLQTQNTDLHNQLNTANGTISDLQNNLITANSTISSLQTQNTNLQNQLNTANSTISILQTQNTNLQNQLNTASGTILVLQNDLSAANSTIIDLQAQLSACLTQQDECTCDFVSVQTRHVASVQIYPNPAQNFVYVQADFWIERIEIFNSSGIRVFVGAYGIRPNQTSRIDLRDFAEGVYFVRIYGNDGAVTTQKLIVK